MNLKKTALGVLTVSLLAGAAAPSTHAWSFGEFFGTKISEQGKPMMMKFHKKGDRFAKAIPMSEETQQLFEELKAAREAGDEAKVEELREELKVQHQAEQVTREAELDAAIAGGYEAWRAFSEAKGMPGEIFEKMTPENFSVFVEIHQTRKRLRELELQLGIQEAGPHHLFIEK